MSEYHNPVLLDESVSALIQNPSGTYIDATFGGGGHTAEILSRLSESGKVIEFPGESTHAGLSIETTNIEFMSPDAVTAATQIGWFAPAQ